MVIGSSVWNCKTGTFRESVVLINCEVFVISGLDWRAGKQKSF